MDITALIDLKRCRKDKSSNYQWHFDYAESHISVHSFEDKGYCFIDIFSCKPFDYHEAIRLTKEIF